MTEIPSGQLVMLQSEITTFQGWMGNYIDSAQLMDQVAALAQLKQEFEAFDGWMTAFLADVMGTGPTTLPAVSSAVPVTAAPASSVVAALTMQPENSAIAALSSSLPLPKVSSSLPPTSSTEAKTSSSPLAALISSSPVAAVVVPSPSASASSVVAQELLVPSHNSHTTSAVSTPAIVPASSAPISSVPVASTSASAAVAPAPSTPSGSGSSFNAGSSSNVAVYYGQTGATGQVSLAQMCQDSDVDIIILSFLTTFFGPGGYPTLNLGTACSGSSTMHIAKGATGLLSCPKVAQDITTCQGLGKKVLLSLGGADATTALSSTLQAGTFATQLWNLFGGGTGESSEMKPFGNVKIDGFDLGMCSPTFTSNTDSIANIQSYTDNEDHSTAFYSEFVASLRKAMNSDGSKKYYISAAPQCPRPDASIPLDAMQTMDFVFVQFYNNGQCDVGQSGFVDSLKAWSADLSAKGAGPKLYTGAPGCSACAGAGYVDHNMMGTVLASAKSAGVSNLGGVMLWDGPEAKVNAAGGKNYLQVVKSALG